MAGIIIGFSKKQKFIFKIGKLLCKFGWHDKTYGTSDSMTQIPYCKDCGKKFYQLYPDLDDN